VSVFVRLQFLYLTLRSSSCFQIESKVRHGDWRKFIVQGTELGTNTKINGFGGLVVSMLASGSRVRGFDPDRSRWIFSDAKKILSMPSFGGEVK
jgi:hypothetical protein